MAEQAIDLGALGVDLADPLRERWRGATIGCKERDQAPADDGGGIFAPHRQNIFAVQLGAELGLAQDLADGLLDKIRATLFDDEHGLLACTEPGDLCRHQRMHHIQH